jgi:hypothetical protein
MNRNLRTVSTKAFWLVQFVFVGSLLVSYSGVFASPTPVQPLLGKFQPPVVPIPRTKPLRLAPLYNEPTLVSDDELGKVLAQVRPRFEMKRLRPNFVEHALRAWGVDAEFADPKVMSGKQMKDFLVDHGKWLAAWGADTSPLLNDADLGVNIRWGVEEGGSVHHDHWLACLTEAGVSLDEPVFTPSNKLHTIADVVEQALRDFRLDERETEWSAMAFGLWIAPTKSWQSADGRTLSFDLLARRLIRGHKRLGVCNGTHRLYSLMLLYRLDDEYKLLDPVVKREIRDHLMGVRDNLIASQFEDGHWPTNWMEGKAAVEKPVDDALFRKVIATGHHIEWMGIAPQEFHVPRSQLEKSFRFIIDTTISRPTEEVLGHYTFYSHVVAALSNWRGTRAADFWRTYEAAHPEVNQVDVKPISGSERSAH